MVMSKGLAALGMVLAVGTSCGSGETSAEPNLTVTSAQLDLTVTVATGIDPAPADMQAADSPVAQYFADSGKVVYVSGGLYSGTCPPKGSATQDGETITLTLADSGDGNCTADAVRDTFKIEHVSSAPSRLVIKQAGQPDIRLDVSS
jgi:hypothetical protein